MNQVGMNLAQRDQRPRRALCRGSRSQQNLFAIAFHAGAKVVFGKADVQRASTIAGSKAAGARGESVHQPRNAVELCRRKNLRLRSYARLCRSMFTESWHTFILIASFLIRGNGHHLSIPKSRLSALPAHNNKAYPQNNCTNERTASLSGSYL